MRGTPLVIQGFHQVFDKATREGYVNGESWFRTHPLFYQRMVDTRREIMFQSAKPDMLVQTSAFDEMQSVEELCSESPRTVNGGDESQRGED